MAILTKRRQADGSISYRVQDRTTGLPSLSKTFGNLKDAREFRRKIEAERQASMAGLTRGRKSLADAVEAFVATDEFRRRRSGKDTARHLRWWTDRMGRLPLATISAELIADHLHRLEAGGCTGATVNRYRSALSRLFRYAIRTRRWADQNPCAMVERRPEGKARERVIKPPEWIALIEAAKAGARANEPYSPRSQLANFLTLAYGTAARSSDVRRLRWEYVDMTDRTVTFHEPKQGRAYTIPLMGDALTAIRDQARLRRAYCPWVFPSSTGDQTPASFNAAFARARAAAGLDGVDAKGERLVIHSLRHSAATEAGRAGATAFEVAALTGHSTLEMVRRYTKTDQAHAMAALRKRGLLK